MTDEDQEELLLSFTLVNLELSNKLLDTDWDDEKSVALSEKRQRVLSAYGRNIEKCIAMTNTYMPNDKADGSHPDIEALKDQLQRRLVRYAERLGREELSRRLRARGVDVDDPRMGVLGEAGSTSADED